MFDLTLKFLTISDFIVRMHFPFLVPFFLNIFITNVSSKLCQLEQDNKKLIFRFSFIHLCGFYKNFFVFGKSMNKSFESFFGAFPKNLSENSADDTNLLIEFCFVKYHKKAPRKALVKTPSH